MGTLLDPARPYVSTDTLMAAPTGVAGSFNLNRSNSAPAWYQRSPVAVAAEVVGKKAPARTVSPSVGDCALAAPAIAAATIKTKHFRIRTILLMAGLLPCRRFVPEN
jgi:hypothetical protein